MARPTTKSLTESESGYVRWLAEQIEAATDILDDVNGSQIFYRHDEEQHRKVLRVGLNEVIRENAQRIMAEVACTPTPRAKPTLTMRAVK